MRFVLGLLIIFARLTVCYKFLAFSPQFAMSHVNFLAKIADTLVDAGHEVVILAPRVNPSIKGALAKKARVIELPENEFTKRWSAGEERLMDLYWNASMITLAMEGSEVMQNILRAANGTLHYPGLIDQLRAEKFDAAFTENPLGFGIFHMAGIDKTAIASSFTNFESSYSLTQMPSNPAYVPSIFSAYGDRMSFWQRVKNKFMSVGYGLLMTSILGRMEPLVEQFTPGVTLLDMASANSLVLLNSEPLLDYPRPTVHRVVEIGGVTTATDVEALSQYWSDILARRNRSVILSFGTYVRASVMPEVYKETIRNALAKFPDVTFIWKYEIPEHNVSQGISNIVETTWMPQVALLNDPRLTAFITHGGQGSTLEAVYAGTPMLMVPTQGDQFRNAAMIKRAGLGEIVQLSELEDTGRLEAAVADLLENEQYASNARKMSAMLRDRPFSAKEKLVRNMEFLAAHGPLRMLDHEGRNLNFAQYYLIDVVLFIVIVTILVLCSIGLACFASCRFCYWKVRRCTYESLKKE
ncbi:hypothetical protein PRIPAC_78154 [Pristionchus pacificus]|uniref:UDP-glucuronosyltransferase n=1 Tax=Pristionchus pacificus TaxID=54126 RepID=A0A2A6CPN0_PRIPA|nr:hypothetical protein PRIPAC_78154 [Pristionchus pacificus]|eukprot:PDM80165.1 Glycosyltransferase [Pristionchus pacificus]